MATRPILIVRHHAVATNFYDVILHWIADRYPQLVPCFTLGTDRSLPEGPAGFAAVVFWMQDPVEAITPDAYRKCARFITRCEAEGIPTINPVTRLHVTERSKAYPLIAAAGLRVPRLARITDLAAWRRDLLGLTPPLMIREDAGHQRLMYRADTADQARKLEAEFLSRPVAIEITDVQSPDGLYLKRRFFAAGRRGISHHLITTPNWITRGGDRIFTDETRAAELAYVNHPDPLAPLFLRATESMGLDILAFDYGLLPNGSHNFGAPIVWEANPFPLIKFGQSTSAYRNHALHRTIAAMVTHYLEKAGIEPPRALVAEASY